MGNIMIEDNIANYVEVLYCDYKILTKLYDEKIYDKVYCCYQINNGFLTINTWLNGNIFSITCNQDYKGLYKDKIYTGISVGELLSLPTRQMIIDDD
ncbi:unnamed protein product [Commensalibacter communis]|uniref:hypothetical protein n=1 Tax=Commensalibacter communis TaxID=2972786 RepID=UPI0022FF6E9C|nr:hypothetical protein [Commensalibacter communis]CAI3941528.1 unnamed protein product [Commensalibacter communis]CAI3942830.1 unnamed protein product [Commensalibacter communis]